MWFSEIFSKIIAFFVSIFAFFNGGVVSPDETEKTVYDVSFYNYDESLIIKRTVDEGAYAEPPQSPQKKNAKFLGWSGNYVNVTKDESIEAIFNDENNVFVVSQGTAETGDLIKVNVCLDGNVNLCGFDITIRYDSNLELVDYDDELDLDVVTNSKKKDTVIFMNFSSSSNITEPKKFLEMTFKVKTTTKKELPIKLSVNALKRLQGNSVIDMDYNLVDGIIFVK